MHQFRPRLAWSTPRWLAEIALVGLVAVAVGIQVAVAAEPGTGGPSPLAYGIGVLIALLLPARHRWPLGMLFASVTLLVLYYALGSPSFSPVIPLAVPLYSAALAGHLLGASIDAGIAVGTAWLFAVFQDGQSLPASLNEVLPQAGMLAALVLLGETVRGRRAAIRMAEQERENESQRRVTEERLRIARELHDVLAHTLAGAAVQAGVAIDTVDDEPETSRAALAAVRAAYRDARAELAATIGVLRAEVGDGDNAPAPGIGALDRLLDTAREAGLRVSLETTGSAQAVPAAVELHAYRIVQESLTNVVQHARADSVTVAMDQQPRRLVLSITDDGTGEQRTTGSRQGYGQLGMRERAAAVGGELSIGSAPGGGYQVRAVLPFGEAT